MLVFDSLFCVFITPTDKILFSPVNIGMKNLCKYPYNFANFTQFTEKITLINLHN